jgi:hypothetical protein
MKFSEAFRVNSFGPGQTLMDFTVQTRHGRNAVQVSARIARGLGEAKDIAGVVLPGFRRCQMGDGAVN